jgi:hypothetical protein
MLWNVNETGNSARLLSGAPFTGSASSAAHSAVGELVRVARSDSKSPRALTGLEIVPSANRCESRASPKSLARVERTDGPSMPGLTLTALATKDSEPRGLLGFALKAKRG